MKRRLFGDGGLPEIVDGVSRRISWMAEVEIVPGEDELRALTEGALRVLRGEEPALPYAPGG